MKGKTKQTIITTSIIIVAIFITIAILTIILIEILNGEEIELTQLKNNTERQMMGYIIKTKGTKVIVIDGGLQGDAQNLISKINEDGGKVDTWFLTHPHMDHVQAFIEIVENTDIEINQIYVTLNDLDWYKEYEKDRIQEIEDFFTTLENPKIKDKVEQVNLGQIIKIDNIKCEILGIKNPEITTNPVNNSSMVIKMKVNNKSILFLADTGEESGNKLLKNQKEKLKSDIVQMAHHGQNGATEELYKQINPHICLWPTPEWLWDNNPGTGYNTGNWKTIETRTWMQNLGVKTNYIEKDGDTIIKIK